MTPLYDAAVRTAAESPPPGDFPRTGLIPLPGSKKTLIAAGWPTARAAVTITKPESVDPRTGWHRPERVQSQEVLYVPETWGRRLCEIWGVKLSEVFRGRYDPAV